MDRVNDSHKVVVVRPVILAGGLGKRFWPISRVNRPKQFLSITKDGTSLIHATAERLAPLCKDYPPVVVTSAKYVEMVREHVSNAEIICEPFGKNTAASVGLAAIFLKKASPGCIMAVFPSDHCFKDEEKLIKTVLCAAEVAKDSGALVTIGIEPLSPNTGYGYIKLGSKIKEGVYRVSRFFEKPSLERAKSYLESGGFLWNSGIFVWTPDALLDGIREFLPDLYSGLKDIEEVLGSEEEESVIKAVFEKIESVSIDLGVLEHATNCVVVEGKGLGWSDVGSWDAWGEYFESDANGNLVKGDVCALDCSKSIIASESRFVAAVGCEGVVIIDTPDALLVCARDRAQDVKEIVTMLEQKGRKDLI
ncbi:MAG: mannose-1-phosphate guanylyltransferase [Candidatus Dadabacteria bacterium]|nr:MAG: mannose-1-phosphate guanylyltransferase [Candidatus Dadabacteria bacterium]